MVRWNRRKNPSKASPSFSRQFTGNHLTVFRKRRFVEYIRSAERKEVKCFPSFFRLRLATTVEARNKKRKPQKGKQANEGWGWGRRFPKIRPQFTGTQSDKAKAGKPLFVSEELSGRKYTNSCSFSRRENERKSIDRSSSHFLNWMFNAVKPTKVYAWRRSAAKAVPEIHKSFS